MMKPYILVVGELLIDAISHVQIDNLSEATVLNVHAGGSAANFCRYLKRCGTDAKLIATVGDDGFGRILLDKVEKDELSTDHITRLKGHVTSMIVVARTSGTPDFIPYRDADFHISAPEPALITGAALVHTSAFSLSKNPGRDVIIDTFSKAAAHHIPLSIDWNYSEKIWEDNDEAWEVLNVLLQYQPYLKFSLDDVIRFAGRPMNISQAMDFLNDFSSACICLTCGEDGVYYKTTNQDWAFVPAQKIKVVNATGAGDAFWAGFMHSVIEQKPVKEGVSAGIETASLKLQGKLIGVNQS